LKKNCPVCRGTGKGTRVLRFLWHSKCELCSGTGKVETETHNSPAALASSAPYKCEPRPEGPIRQPVQEEGGSPLLAAGVAALAGGDPLIAGAAAVVTGSTLVGVAAGIAAGQSHSVEREPQGQPESPDPDQEQSPSGDGPEESPTSSGSDSGSSSSSGDD